MVQFLEHVWKFLKSNFHRQKCFQKQLSGAFFLFKSMSVLILIRHLFSDPAIVGYFYVLQRVNLAFEELLEGITFKKEGKTVVSHNKQLQTKYFITTFLKLILANECTLAHVVLIIYWHFAFFSRFQLFGQIPYKNNTRKRTLLAETQQCAAFPIVCCLVIVSNFSTICSNSHLERHYLLTRSIWNRYTSVRCSVYSLHFEFSF